MMTENTQAALSGMSRAEVIEHVVRNLRQSLDDISRHGEHYRKPLEENLAFLEAIRTFFGWARWAWGRARRLDPDSLLELADFPWLPYGPECTRQLIAVQRKTFPGLIRALVEALDFRILRLSRERGAGVTISVLEIGPGGCEVVRQLIERWRQRGSVPHVRFLCVEIDGQLVTVAIENLRVQLESGLLAFETISNGEVPSWVAAGQDGAPVKLGYLTGAAVDVLPGLGERFDLAFHSLMKHHIPTQQREVLDGLLVAAANEVIEYDCWRSLLSFLGATHESWNEPLQLNAALFSTLRGSTLQQVMASRGDTWTVRVLKMGWYLRIHAGAGGSRAVLTVDETASKQGRAR